MLAKILAIILFSVNFFACTAPTEITIPVLTFPNWPLPCCYTIPGCDVTALSNYCPSCPNVCLEIDKCDCYFPGTNEIIKRRPIDETPRPPFCSECPLRKCKNYCPIDMKECTLDNARAFIAL